jgi:hypothetical protein
MTSLSSCGSNCGWFLPTVAQLYNPGYLCRIQWDYNATDYWSCQVIPVNPSYVCFVSILNGTCSCSNGGTRCARAFRCVTY